MTIDQMIENTIGKEGGYSDNPNDTGGKTMWGITEAVARRNGYTGDMRAIPRSTAVSIYRTEYAVKPGFVAVSEINSAVGEELFDTGVNMGPSIPARWLQQCLNGLNNGGKLYADIAEDGQIGPATLGALRLYMKARGADATPVLLKALNCLQGARYIELARTRLANETFLFGWIKNRVSL